MVRGKGARTAVLRTHWKRNSGAYFCARAMFSGVGAALAVNARKAMDNRLGMEVCQGNLGGGRFGGE